MPLLSPFQEHVLEKAIAARAAGIGLYGTGWGVARSLVRRGLGRIEGKAECRGGTGGRFYATPDASERLASFRKADLPPSAHDPLYPQRAITVAASLAGVEPSDLYAKGCRPSHLVQARWALMLGLRRHQFNPSQISRRLQRDRKTVTYGLEHGAALAVIDPEFAALAEKVAAA